MRKFHVFSTTLLMALLTTPSLHAATSTIDGCQILGQGCVAAEPAKPQLIALSWGDVFKLLTGKKGSKGRRNPLDNPNSHSCMIVPGIMADLNDPLVGTANTVMSRQPLFLWHGKVTQIAVYDADNIEQEPIWTAKIKPGQRSIFYDGDVPLEPNSLGYSWQLTLENPPASNPDEKPRKAFMILDEETTAAIQKQFDEIEQQPISTQEKALKRIEILSQEKYGPTGDEALGADILAELHQLKEWPPEMASLKDHDFCADSEASVS